MAILLVVLSYLCPIALAVGGGLLAMMPESAARIERNRGLKWPLFALFVVFGLLSVGSGLALQAIDEKSRANLNGQVKSLNGQVGSLRGTVSALSARISLYNKSESSQHKEIIARLTAPTPNPAPTAVPLVLKVEVPAPRATPASLPTVTPFPEPNIGIALVNLSAAPGPQFNGQPMTNLTVTYSIKSSLDVALRSCISWRLFPVGETDYAAKVIASLHCEFLAPLPVYAEQPQTVIQPMVIPTQILEQVVRNQENLFFASFFSLANGKWRREMMRCDWFSQNMAHPCAGVGLP